MEQTADKRTLIISSTHIPSAIMRLALPAIVSMVVMAIYNMVDTYFVSVVSDTDLEVAAISVFMPILLLTQSVSVLFAAGGAAYLSRLIGEGDQEKANRAATTTVLLSLISGIIVLVVGCCFSEPILMAFGASRDTIGMATDYALVMFLAAPVQLTNMSFNNLLRAEGNAVRSMVGIATGAILNIFLDPIFITTLGMGVMGAAVATAIAQCVSFVILGSAYWMKRTTAVLHFRGFRFDGQIVRYILKIGLSNFLIQIFTAVSFAIINIYCGPYGDGVIAAVGIVNRLQYLGFAILFGFSQGFQPVCGYNFGAGRFKLLKTTLAFGIGVSMAIGAGIVVLFRFCGAWLVDLFTDSAQVLKTGIDVLSWFTCAYPLTAFSLTMMMTYQALGRAVGALVIACCRQGVCMIPTVMVLSEVWGFQGILVSPLISDAVSGFIALILAIRIMRYIRSESESRGEGHALA